MKKTLIASLMLLSVSAVANTTLLCNDENSRSVYKLELNSNNSRLEFSPLLKDSSELSSSTATLRYNEGESNKAYSLYEGNNKSGNTIVLELRNETIAVGNTAEVNVYYTSTNSQILNNKTSFLCEVR